MTTASTEHLGSIRPVSRSRLRSPGTTLAACCVVAGLIAATGLRVVDLGRKAEVLTREQARADGAAITYSAEKLSSVYKGWIDGMSPLNRAIACRSFAAQDCALTTPFLEEARKIYDKAFGLALLEAHEQMKQRSMQELGGNGMPGKAFGELMDFEIRLLTAKVETPCTYRDDALCPYSGIDSSTLLVATTPQGKALLERERQIEDIRSSGGKRMIP